MAKILSPAGRLPHLYSFHKQSIPAAGCGMKNYLN
jgi:hypothetical protein